LKQTARRSIQVETVAAPKSTFFHPRLQERLLQSVRFMMQAMTQLVSSGKPSSLSGHAFAARLVAQAMFARSRFGVQAAEADQATIDRLLERLSHRPPARRRTKRLRNQP
jgi:hypothetical protein